MNQPLFVETDPRPRYWETLARWGERWGMGTYREPRDLKRVIESWKPGAPDARGVFYGEREDAFSDSQRSG